ncbi:MAG: YjaG family protein, partial [Lachnospiraceae bacterium]|nr:YjaG family protein [Lachnospiraceae bacterium]
MKESRDKGQGNWDAHLMQIEVLMKGQPFWKIALFGVMCAERQWPVYERLCVGREWGNAKGMRKVMERIWQAIPTGYAIGDSYMG